MRIRAVIFDLDGTLTKPVLNFDLIRSEMGISSHSVGILEAMQQMPSDTRQKAMDILDRHELYAAINAVLHDGVHEVFGFLRQHDIPIGLLTRNTRQNVTRVAAQHNLIFDAVVDRDDGPAKPDGFGVRKLCEIFDVPPAETIVVGDFLHDLHAAHNAGATAVLIRTHPKAAEFQDQADYTIDCIQKLIPLIQQLEQNRSSYE